MVEINIKDERCFMEKPLSISSAFIIILRNYFIIYGIMTCLVGVMFFKHNPVVSHIQFAMSIASFLTGLILAIAVWWLNSKYKTYKTRKIFVDDNLISYERDAESYRDVSKFKSIKGVVRRKNYLVFKVGDFKYEKFDRNNQLLKSDEAEETYVHIDFQDTTQISDVLVILLSNSLKVDKESNELYAKIIEMVKKNGNV